MIALFVAAGAVMIPAGAFAADQTNAATQTTVVDDHGSQSAGLITGPIVIPVDLGLGANAQHGMQMMPVMGMLSGMGMGTAMPGTQSSSAGQVTVVDHSGSQSAGLITGPIVVPVNGLLGLNLGL
ncbi:MAG TPA: hypothetical protein VIC57_19795 [Candidatus Dormibacteraeota bacterium]